MFAGMAAILISVFSLLVSMTTAWLTLFRRRTVKMTKPTVIFVGPDTPRSKLDNPLPKVFLRALLFAKKHSLEGFLRRHPFATADQRYFVGGPSTPNRS